MSSFKFTVTGADKVIKAFETSDILGDIDRITETYTRKMANTTAERAPVKSGKLRDSFPPSVRKEGPGIWSYGSHLPYATRQEYEHRTKKGFVRKTVWENRTPYREAIKERIDKIGGGL